MSDDEVEFVYSSSQYKRIKNPLEETQVLGRQKSDEVQIITTEVQTQHNSLEATNTELVGQTAQIKELLDCRTKILEQNEQESTQILQNSVIKLNDLLIQREKQMIKVLRDKMNQTLSIEELTESKNQNERTASNLTAQVKKLEEGAKCLSQELKILANENAQSRAQYQSKVTELVKTAQIVEEKQVKINELKSRFTHMEKQTQDLINELMENKKNQLTESGFAQKPKEQLMKLNEVCDKLKQENQYFTQESAILKEQLIYTMDKQEQSEKKISQYQKTIAKLEEDLEIINHEKLRVKRYEQVEQVEIVQPQCDEKLKMKCIKQEQSLHDQKNLIDELISLNKKLQNDLDKHKSGQQESTKMAQLQKEVTSLEQMLYESPVEIIFNLLEDRLSKQNRNQPKDKKDQRHYWTQVLGQWIQGLQELEQNFKGLNILFSYQISRK